MDDKLKLFLEKINLKEDYYNYFSNGRIIKIKSSKDKLNWNFIIETEELLPLEVIKFLDENINNGFKNLNTVTYTIIPKKSDSLLVNNYYPYVIQNASLSEIMSKLFKEKNIKFTTDSLEL